MFRSLALALAVVIGSAALMYASHHDADGEKVKVLSANDIVEKLNGKEGMATVVEVSIAPGQGGVPHRHPGSAIGYVLEGEYELGIDDKPTKVIKAGETFYEPAGCLHRVSRNPGKVNTRLIAVVLHPRSNKEIAVPEPAKP
ncbi:cupin domain-containing protein [Anatilimnocola sp. NA78]|uniref:cupin domain-containing protein n=1 Tax=Anatilimnocola sp. NA78 TaxID=3415683 RepID=UPI003CE4CE24